MGYSIPHFGTIHSQGSTRTPSSSGHALPLCNTPPDKRCFALQIIPESANSSCFTGGYLTACLDFPGDQLAGLFQDEIHFVSRAVAPEVQLAAPDRNMRFPPSGV